MDGPKEMKVKWSEGGGGTDVKWSKKAKRVNEGSEELKEGKNESRAKDARVGGRKVMKVVNERRKNITGEGA